MSLAGSGARDNPLARGRATGHNRGTLARQLDLKGAGAEVRAGETTFVTMAYILFVDWTQPGG